MKKGSSLIFNTKICTYDIRTNKKLHVKHIFVVVNDEDVKNIPPVQFNFNSLKGKKERDHFLMTSLMKKDLKRINISNSLTKHTNLATWHIYDLISGVTKLGRFAKIKFMIYHIHND